MARATKAGLTEREYAARAGLSRRAVGKAKAAGQLALYADGSIDPGASDARRGCMTDPANAKKSPAAEVEARPELEPVSEAAVSAVEETLREEGVAVQHGRKGVTFVEAKIAHELIKTNERKVKLQQLKGQLVDRGRATALVYRLAREERDAWATWPARVAAEIAAEVGVDVDRMQRALERRVRDHLASLSEPRLTLTSR